MIAGCDRFAGGLCDKMYSGSLNGLGQLDEKNDY